MSTFGKIFKPVASLDLVATPRPHEEVVVLSGTTLSLYQYDEAGANPVFVAGTGGGIDTLDVTIDTTTPEYLAEGPGGAVAGEVASIYGIRFPLPAGYALPTTLMFALARNEAGTFHPARIADSAGTHVTVFLQGMDGANILPTGATGSYELQVLLTTA